MLHFTQAKYRNFDYFPAIVNHSISVPLNVFIPEMHLWTCTHETPYSVTLESLTLGKLTLPHVWAAFLVLILTLSKYAHSLDYNVVWLTTCIKMSKFLDFYCGRISLTRQHEIERHMSPATSQPVQTLLWTPKHLGPIGPGLLDFRLLQFL